MRQPLPDDILHAVLFWSHDDLPQQFPLAGHELSIGRGSSCDLMLQSSSVSRVHAKITYSDGNYYITDLGSSFGTRVNGLKLDPNQAFLLHNGDKIACGKQVIQFQVGETMIPVSTDISSSTPTMEIKFSNIVFLSELENLRERMREQIRSAIPDGEKATILISGIDDQVEKFAAFLRAKFNEHEVLQEITRQIVRILDVKELLSTALRLVIKVLKADRGFILLYDSRHGTLKTMVPHRFDPQHEGSMYDFTFSNSIANNCFQDKRMIFINDALQDERFRSAQSIVASSIRSVVCIPLQQADEIAGVIYLDSLHTPGLFHEHQGDFLRSFSYQTAIALENAKLYTQAVTDELTRLYNRKHIDKRIFEEMGRARRYDRPCCILILDIDFFKKVNDTYGHGMGDLVLEGVANVLRENARSTDIVARYGGEEFLMLLPETDLKGADIFAERLREAIESMEVSKDSLTIKVTTSIGVAYYTPDFKHDVRAFVEHADRALYRAKREGRNRVIIAEEPLVTGG